MQNRKSQGNQENRTSWTGSNNKLAGKYRESESHDSIHIHESYT